MDTPNAAAVRDWLADPQGGETFDLTGYGFPQPDQGGEDRLDRVVRAAVAYVQAVTGRRLDASLPDDLKPLAEDAVAMRVQQVVVSRTGPRSTRAVRDALQSGEVSSLRAGDYAITYRDRGRKAGDTQIRVNDWPALNEVLLLLMTPEKLAEVEAQQTGQERPLVAGVPLGQHYL